MSRRMRIALAWAPSLAYMALIWAMSSVSHPTIPVGSFPFADKGVHALEYGLLGLLVAHAMRNTFPDRHLVRTAVAAILVTVGWGVLDELHQAFVPGRSSDVLDVVADAIGASLGVLAQSAWTFASRAVRARVRSGAP